MNEQSKGFRYWVGVDWGCEEHEVCALSAEGQQNETFEHGGKGISALVDWVVAACDGQVDALAVGIEKSHGAVVEALMEREIAVFAINPKQADRFRDRHSVAGAKDDELDAYVIADSLRTDMKLYRRVHKEMPQIVQLRERSRMYDELKNERIRLSNRLYAHLHRYYPAILRLSPAADEPWIWSLLEQAPTPQAGQRLRPVTIKRLLREHRIRRLTAAEVHEQLRQPALRLAPGTVEAASEHVLLLLPRIRLVDQQKNRCKRDIRSALDQLPQPKDAAGDPGAEGNPAHDDQDTKVEHRDVDIIRSLPGIGDLIAATVLSEASQRLISKPTA